MKKILSLLSMLMITVMAFATDYKGQLDYAIKIYSNSYPASIAEGTLSITQYDNGNYQVTAKDCNIPDIGNFGNVVCDGLSGTTDANGVTTIDVTDCTAGLDGSSWTDLSSTKLLVKFNKEKAYATFEGKYQVGVWRTVSYTFGTDDFGSTGGSTGGGTVTEKYTVNFDKTAYSNHSSRVLNSFSLQQTGKEKQTESVSASRAAYEDHTSKVFTVEAGSEVTASFNYTGEWMNGYVYIDRDNDGEFSYTEGQWNQANTDLVAYSFYTTLDNPKVNDGNGYNSTGASVTGNARSNVNPPAFTAPTEPGTYRIRFKVDWNCILPGGSSDILSDGGGVWDATLEVVAPAPTVEKEVPFTGVTLSGSNGVTGTADVTFKEMSDETVQMTFNGGGYGISATNLTKGTDEKGRTTYTGTAKRTDVDVTFTVKAVVYGETTAQKLYMTMDNGSSLVVTVGEDPDYVAPEPEIEGTVVEGSKNYAANGSKFEWSNIAINWNKQKLVAVIDLSSCTGTSENILSVGQNIGSWSIGGWHFYYTVASKKMKSDYLATDGAHPVSDPKTGVEPGTVRIELSKAEGCTIDGVSYNALYDSNVTGTWQSNTEDFWNLTSVNIGSKEGANRSNAVIKYVTVVDLPVTVKEEKTFNEALYMNEQKVADAKVVVKEMSDETVNMSLQFSGYEYTSTELTKGTDTKGRTTYTGKVANGEQTYDVKAVVYEKDNTARLYMTMITGVTTVVVGENPDAVTPEVTEVSNNTYTSNLRIFDGEEPVVEAAEAKVNIIKYSDESCKVTLKNITLNGKTADLVFVGKFDTDEPALDQLAEGDDENGTVTPEGTFLMTTSDDATTEFFGAAISATFEWQELSENEIKMFFNLEGGSISYEGEFNYDENSETAINGIHAANDEAQLFTVDGVKLSKLQKGLNIVRTADGKVKKVLVK